MNNFPVFSQHSLTLFSITDLSILCTAYFRHTTVVFPQIPTSKRTASDLPPIFTSINYSIISAFRAIKSYSAFSATRTISLFTFFALHRLQIPFGKWRHPFATLAKPFRQVATPFCNSCKALSASGDTILQQLQSPVSMWRYPFATDAKPCRQVAIPLYNCCNAF